MTTKIENSQNSPLAQGTEVTVFYFGTLQAGIISELYPTDIPISRGVKTIPNVDVLLLESGHTVSVGELFIYVGKIPYWQLQIHSIIPSCPLAWLAEVEDTLRHVILHGGHLNSLSKQELVHAVKDAYEVVEIMQTPSKFQAAMGEAKEDYMAKLEGGVL
jgi:hypothetical protein